MMPARKPTMTYAEYFAFESDSTEAYDRGEKAAHYRHLPSLREYVLVSQHRPRIEVYRKSEAGRWELYEYESGSRLELTSVR